MKSREYGTWPPRNGLSPERQKLYDPYNRAFKGESYLHVDEYASMDVEEYYHVPETKDMSGNPYEQNRVAQSSQVRRAKSKGRLRQNMLRQVVGVLVGSVIIVTTYQAMAAKQNVPEPDAVIQTEDQTPDTPSKQDQTNPEPIQLVPNWKWSDDKQTVILELLDSDGNLIKEIPATLSISEKPATCNQEGQKTYTATVEDEDKQYSDSQSETLPPLGHAFDGGKETVLENGKTVIIFECTRCHEQFTFETSIKEND